MLRDRTAGGTLPGGPFPPAWPVLPMALLAGAVLAAVLAGHADLPSWLLALSLLLAVAGALLSGAYWSRQRQAERLHDARMQSQLLGQLLEVWTWQTDTEHRLVKLAPPNILSSTHVR